MRSSTLLQKVTRLCSGASKRRASKSSHRAPRRRVFESLDRREMFSASAGTLLGVHAGSNCTLRRRRQCPRRKSPSIGRAWGTW